VALFRYRAATPEGGVHEGEMTAPARNEVVSRLQGDGLIPIRVEVAGGRRVSRRPRSLPMRRARLPARDVAFFTVELATLLEARVPLGRALELLAGLAERPAARALLERLDARVRGGATFADALAQDAAGFGPFYLNMVRAGERGGTLGQTLRRLAAFLERAAEMRETLLAALWYPAILFVVAIMSLGIIVGVVLPRFAEMFAEAGRDLPLATQVVMAAGTFLQDWGWLVAAAIAGGALTARQMLQRPDVRRQVDAWLLGLPLVGAVVSEVEAARFTRALGTLLSGGVTLAEALPIARDALGNQAVVEAIGRVIPEVRAGRGLAVPLAECGVFPRLAAELVKVGEEAGRLEAMLNKLADTYEREVAVALRRLVALAGPSVILLLGAMIGAVILSILVAMLGINQLVH
jgi:general secretion pathway protein F